MLWLPTTVCDHATVESPIVERLKAPATEPDTIDVPVDAVEKSTSVRIDLVRRAAPSIFNSPAPCDRVLAPASGWAVYSTSVLIMFGVRRGLSCKSIAAAPLTAGAATEVPLKYIWALSTVPIG